MSPRMEGYIFHPGKMTPGFLFPESISEKFRIPNPKGISQFAWLILFYSL